MSELIDIFTIYVMPILVLIQFVVAIFRYISAKKQLALKGTDFWVRECRRIRTSLEILGPISGTIIFLWVLVILWILGV